MKASKSIFVSLIIALLMSVSAMAQSQVKVLAVVNHADWCGACKGNGERAQGVFAENNREGNIHFVVNDLTSDDSKQNSAKELTKHGLLKPMENKTKSGLVYFFDAETKELITEVSVAKSSEEIASAMKTATKGLK